MTSGILDIQVSKDAGLDTGGRGETEMSSLSTPGDRAAGWGRWAASLAQGTKHLTAPEYKVLRTHAAVEPPTRLISPCHLPSPASPARPSAPST